MSSTYCSFFFFKQKTAYEIRPCDWSSDVCSSDLMLERVDRAHRALEAFTADASHELRTPLTHLRAQVQWASAEERSEPQMREALMAMERELERTTKLVDELLLIARGENRQLALAHVPFDLRMVVDEVKEITEAMGGALNRAVA